MSQFENVSGERLALLARRADRATTSDIAKPPLSEAGGGSSSKEFLVCNGPTTQSAPLTAISHRGRRSAAFFDRRTSIFVSAGGSIEGMNFASPLSKPICIDTFQN